MGNTSSSSTVVYVAYNGNSTSPSSSKGNVEVVQQYINDALQQYTTNFGTSYGVVVAGPPIPAASQQTGYQITGATPSYNDIYNSCLLALSLAPNKVTNTISSTVICLIVVT